MKWLDRINPKDGGCSGCADETCPLDGAAGKTCGKWQAGLVRPDVPLPERFPAVVAVTGEVGAAALRQILSAESNRAMFDSTGQLRRRSPAFVTECDRCGKRIGFDVPPAPGKRLWCGPCAASYEAWAGEQRGIASGLHDVIDAEFSVVESEPDHLTPVLCSGDVGPGPSLDPRRNDR